MSEAPHNIEFERALLAAIFTDNAAIDQLGGLEADAFFDAVHREVFSAMRGLRGGGRAINVATLSGLLGTDPLGGVSILDSLKGVEFGNSTPKPHELAEELNDLAIRRAVLAQGEWLAQQAVSRHAKRGDILATHLREIDALIAKARPQGRTMWGMADAMSSAQQLFQRGESGDRIATGVRGLNKVTGGFALEEVAILAGRPSMGKTALAVSFGTNAAEAGHGVLVFSLEMSMPAWMARVSSEATWEGPGTGIPYVRALRHQLTAGRELETFIRAGARRASLPLVIESQADLSAAEITARTRKVATDFERVGKRLGLVIVDHLGKVRPTKNYRGNRVMEMGEISNAMANLAKAEKVALLCLHQLNRGTESRENKRPTLADLRDSGNIEQDADLVLFAYRPAYYLERAKDDEGSDGEALRRSQLEAKRHVLELAIAKQRNGETATIELFCDMPCNVIRDMDRRQWS
jgi:replicative DNA helicase